MLRRTHVIYFMPDQHHVLRNKSILALATRSAADLRTKSVANCGHYLEDLV
jgi:hypothetical protein